MGDGTQVSVWDDCRIIPNCKLIDFGHQVPDDLRHLKVSDLIDESGEWNLNMIRETIPTQVLDRIGAIHPLDSSSDSDTRLWPGYNLGNFTVSSAYSLLDGSVAGDESVRWKQIWQLKVPERVRSFMWLVAHNKLLTNLQKAQMGIGDSFCVHCGNILDSIIHALRDCDLARSLWMLWSRPPKGVISLEAIRSIGLILI